jgi:3D-(3,5/4)-trihydroxycyclohexane-1,2-dione acylhydrolase (decyclizing)
VFYDGPPFATGLPHYGHILTTYIKDVVPRYETMRGKYVPRLWGWDCHGLPVELEVERELSLASPSEIARYGVAEFNAACRSLVMRYASEWEAIVTRLRTVDEQPGDLSQSTIIGTVNDAVGPEATVICAAGSLPGDLLRLWRSTDPRAYHVEYGFSCMGYEIAAGLGVRLADPDREVVVMVGDGSYLMLNSEIVTAVAEHMKLTIVVVDNHGFQCILALQRSAGIPDFGNELRFRDGSGRLAGPYVPIDFRAHAEAMGATTNLACTLDELRAALARARTTEGVSVIVVPAEPEKRMPSFETWWDVPIPAVSGRGPVQAARRAYDEARSRQRLELH